MTLTTIHVWLLLLTWPTPAKHRHGAMAAILQCAQWTTFWSYVIDRWAVGICPADHVTYDCTSKGEVRNMIWYGESFKKMISFHRKSCILQVNKKFSCSFCIWWKRLKYTVFNKLRWNWKVHKAGSRWLVCQLFLNVSKSENIFSWNSIA
jgi:hypothetical protein